VNHDQTITNVNQISTFGLNDNAISAVSCQCVECTQMQQTHNCTMSINSSCYNSTLNDMFDYNLKLDDNKHERLNKGISEQRHSRDQDLKANGFQAKATTLEIKAKAWKFVRGILEAKGLHHRQRIIMRLNVWHFIPDRNTMFLLPTHITVRYETGQLCC
jgi:hypothetical protein